MAERETHELLLCWRPVQLFTRVIPRVFAFLSDDQENICPKEAVEVVCFANEIYFPSSKVFLSILSGLSVLQLLRHVCRRDQILAVWELWLDLNRPYINLNNFKWLYFVRSKLEPGRKRNGQLHRTAISGGAISGGIASKGVTSGGTLLEHNLRSN